MRRLLMMTLRNKSVVIASIMGLAFTATVAGLSSVPKCEPAAYLLLPGALLAALAFPQGIESDYGYAYLVLTGLLDTVFYGLASFALVSRRMHRARQR